MKSGLVRTVVILGVAITAFALGRWTGNLSPVAERSVERETSAENQPAPKPEIEPAPQPIVEPAPQPEPPPREEVLRAELAAIAEAAKTMSVPDARTYGFFEGLELKDLSLVDDEVEKLPAGNEQDALLSLALRRWAELDGPAALAQASEIPQLGARVEARVAVYQEWAAHDAAAALVRASGEKDESALRRAVSAVLVGAATTDPRNAFSLLDVAPVKFLSSQSVLPTIERMVNAAYGTGKKDDIVHVVAGMRSGDVRTLIIDTLARNWGAHYPAEAYAWVTSLVPEGEARDKIVQNMFTAIAFKDPSRAARWVVNNLNDPARTKYLASAVSQWAQLDLFGAEVWLNEQPDTISLDGGSLALADYFMKERHMSRAYSWIRRINQDEMRTKLFADLGRVWSEERPEEFQRFINETSLNRAEVELLTADVEPAR